MDGRFSNPFVTENEDSGFMLDITDSPPSFSREDKLNHHTPSPKRSKRSLQKRVVSVPIRDGDGSRVKGEGAPPSDSWAWRKYGQKPIKGSPYPRGYYRCSSSKGCPARKQVERSRVDPNMLVITYACDHNHSWPASKTSNPTPTTRSESTKTPTREPKVLPIQTRPEPKIEPKIEPETHYSDLVEDPLITPDDFSWFADVSSTSPTVLESTIYTESSPDDIDMAMIFTVREEDESLFADLGELPECSVVFRRGFIEKEEQLRRCNLRNSLCESTR